MDEIKLKARAKINISLDVIGKRDNGYHDVEMVMQTVDLHDVLLLRKTDDDNIVIQTNDPDLPVDDGNLVYKVIDYMRGEYGLPGGVMVDLYKMIPVAAGLAGGSSDAAQTVIGMNELYDLELDLEEMLEIGGKFGTDIPYCLIQGTALATGLGEVITLLPDFPELDVLIVKPDFGMSTQDVYQTFDVESECEHPNTEKLVQGIKEGDLDVICKEMVNVLETVTPKLHPEINDIKYKLRQMDAIGVLMSGSGPSVYALFSDNEKAQEALKTMNQDKGIQFSYLTKIHNRKKG